MAAQYWQNAGQPQRRMFVALHHAYHGDTTGAMSVSEATAFTSPFEHLLFPVHRVHSPYCHRCPLGLKRAECAIDCLGDLERQLARDGESIAAVIVEPMLQGAGGMIVWPAEFLAGVRRLCDRYGTLLIADEVLTGFGRTGRMFACEHAGITPDFMCLSKGLTAGYLPMAVTAVRETIYQAFFDSDRRKALFHGHSYTANPLGCAVAIASLKLFESEGTLARVKAIEKLFHARLDAIRGFRRVGDVRAIGGVAAIELDTAGGYFDDVGSRLAEAFLQRGLLLRPLGSILYFMPPYVITDQQVDWVFEQIAEVLERLPG
jgi:adenosylmethionine-8-amino-7-oxononanoate aminotransferase